MKKKLLVAITLFSCVLTPVIAFSDVDDVFNCNGTGITTASAGSQTPLGGPYVPVADYAVEKNTGLLVLKECVLREIVTAKRKYAAAREAEKTLALFNGYPSRELGKEEETLSDRTMVRYLQNDSLSKFDDALESGIKNAIARSYTIARDPRKSFECPYNGDLTQAFAGTPSGKMEDALTALTRNPSCSPFSAFTLGYDALTWQAMYEVYKNRSMLEWGDGVYPVVHLDDEGFRITDTPGQIVLQNGIQAEQSGYEQLMQADDIGEMVDNVYTGVSSQVLTPASSNGSNVLGGLAGMAAYLNQVTQSALGQYTGTTGSAALGALQAALGIENQYIQVVTAIVNLLTQTINQLKSAELSCVDQIKSAVCESGSVSGDTCTAAGGTGTLTIATSTITFAQRAINASINSYATTYANQLTLATGKRDRIQAQITLLQANSTAATQAAALAELVRIAPHNGGDVSSAQQNQTSLAQVMATLINSTTDAWKQPGKWCDTTSQAVKDAWTQCWSGTASACPTQ